MPTRAHARHPPPGAWLTKAAAALKPSARCNSLSYLQHRGSISCVMQHHGAHLLHEPAQISNVQRSCQRTHCSGQPRPPTRGRHLHCRVHCSRGARAACCQITLQRTTLAKAARRAHLQSHAFANRSNNTCAFRPQQKLVRCRIPRKATWTHRAQHHRKSAALRRLSFQLLTQVKILARVQILHMGRSAAHCCAWNPVRKNPHLIPPQMVGR